MLLERHLGKGSMKLLKRNVEFSIGIELKTLLCWLINKNRLREQQETRKRRSVIIIIIKRNVKVKKLCASGLCLWEVIWFVESYWKAGFSLVCMICYGIGHQEIGSCRDQPEKYVICARSYKVEDH